VFQYRTPENPDSARIQTLLKQIFSSDSPQGWLLMGYANPDTIVYEAHGFDTLATLTQLLRDDAEQFFLIRLPYNKSGSKTTASRDIFVAWSGPAVTVVERGRRRLHTDYVVSILKPAKAQLEIFNRALLTEQHLLSCSDPRGAAIILDRSAADLRASLPHITSDIGPHQQENNSSASTDRPAATQALSSSVRVKVLDEIKSSDRGVNLRHTIPTKDASNPGLDPHLKLNLRVGMERRNSLMMEIGHGTTLTTPPIINDLSAPDIPLTIKCPHSQKIRQEIMQRFVPDRTRASIMLGYNQSGEMALEMTGSGTVAEITDRLRDDAIQYCLIRISAPEDMHSKPSVLQMYDVVLIWIGPLVSDVEKAKKGSDFRGVSFLLRPHHLSVLALDKQLINDANLLVLCTRPILDADEPLALHGVRSGAVDTSWKQDLTGKVNVWWC